MNVQNVYIGMFPQGQGLFKLERIEESDFMNLLENAGEGAVLTLSIYVQIGNNIQCASLLIPEGDYSTDVLLDVLSSFLKTGHENDSKPTTNNPTSDPFQYLN